MLRKGKVKCRIQKNLKKGKREFRETMKEAADQKTDCEAGGSLCMRVSRIWRSRGGFVCGGKAVCDRCFRENDAGDISVESPTIRTLVSPSDGADADMTAAGTNGAGD